MRGYWWKCSPLVSEDPSSFGNASFIGQLHSSSNGAAAGTQKTSCVCYRGQSSLQEPRRLSGFQTLTSQLFILLLTFTWFRLWLYPRSSPSKKVFNLILISYRSPQLKSLELLRDFGFLERWEIGYFKESENLICKDCDQWGRAPSIVAGVISGLWHWDL